MKFILVIAQTLLTRWSFHLGHPMFTRCASFTHISANTKGRLSFWPLATVNSIINVVKTAPSSMRWYGNNSANKIRLLNNDTHQVVNNSESNNTIPEVSVTINNLNNVTPNLIHQHDSKTWICNAAAVIDHHVKSASTGAKHIQFIMSNDNVDDVVIKVCPIWFGRAIEEILQNAIKHNQDESGFVVNVSTHVSNADFVVTICDNGTGISNNVTSALLWPGNRNIEGIQSKLNAPVNLSTIESLLWHVHGSLQVTSARKFLTRITMKVPLINTTSPNAIGTQVSSQTAPSIIKSTLSSTGSRHAKSTAHNSIHNRKSLVHGNALVNSNALINSNDQANSNAQGISVEEYIADYQITQACLLEVHDRDANKFVKKFTQVLHRHYNDEKFNKSTATKLMLTTDKTLTRRLNTHYKLGFVDILRKFRLQQAASLLLEQESVTSVAFQTGFSSPSYFTRCFKQEFGFTPSCIAKHKLQFNRP